MPLLVALLRGINVGKAKRVAMADLRRIAAELGGRDVATLLNSGNLVANVEGASPAGFAEDLGRAIQKDLGVDVPVIVKSADEFALALHENPFAADLADPTRLLVAFTQDLSSLPGLVDLISLGAGSEEFVVGRHAAYLNVPAGLLESKIGTGLLARKAVTTRNWATCLKISRLLSERA